MSRMGVVASSSRSADDGGRIKDILRYLDLEAEVDQDEEGDDVSRYSVFASEERKTSGALGEEEERKMDLDAVVGRSVLGDIA